MSDKLLTGVQLADVLQVSDETIRKWRRSGTIPGIRINQTTIRYDAADVLIALKRAANAPVELHPVNEQ